MSAYHFKYFQNIQFKNHGIAPTPPDLPTLKAYPTPGVGGRFEIFSPKWRERMNLKVPGAILHLGCAILSTRAKTVRGVGTTPLRRTRVNFSSSEFVFLFSVFYFYFVLFLLFVFVCILLLFLPCFVFVCLFVCFLSFKVQNRPNLHNNVPVFLFIFCSCFV